MDHERLKSYSCQVEAAMDVLGGKYKPIIVYALMEKTLRYNEIQKAIPKATPRMLSKQLRELEADGILQRTVYPVVPPKTEYSLTELGRSLIPVIEAIEAWGTHLYEREGVDLPC